MNEDDLQEGQNQNEGQQNNDEEPFGNPRSPNRANNEEHKSDDMITITADPRPPSRMIDEDMGIDNRPSAVDANFLDDYESNQQTAKKNQMADEIAEAIFKPNDEDLVSEK